MQGTMAVFAAASPFSPRLRTYIPIRQSATPYGSSAPVMFFIAVSAPAIIADSTITAFTVIAPSATTDALPNTARFTSFVLPRVRAATPRSTAIRINIIIPQETGTRKEGAVPKYAATS